MNDELAQASARVACALLVQRCMHAVRWGAPLYNKGALHECISVYELAAHACVNHPQNIPPSVITRLESALSESLKQSCASRKAWLLRHGLDDAIKVAVAIANANVSPPPAPRGDAESEGGKVRHRDSWSSSGEADARGEASTVGWDAGSRQRRHKRSPRPPSPPDVCHLLRLPHDLATILLSDMPALALGRLASTCSSLRALVHTHTATIIERVAPALVEGMAPHAEAGATFYARWLRTLHARELVQARVPRNANGRRFWDEWPRMMAAEEVRLNRGPEAVVDLRAFMRGGARSVARLLLTHQHGVRWMLDAGWTAADACATMLLLSCGAATLGHAVREGNADFAASVHAVCDALRARAAGVSTPAPYTYAAIEGRYGLAAADPQWQQLLGADATVGRAFVTCAPVLAGTHPTRMPDAECAGPLYRLASAPCELRRGAPLVCFLSEPPRCGGDALRTMLQVGPSAYALPPLSTVTLVATLAPGQWVHAGEVIQRRCLCVRVRTPY